MNCLSGPKLLYFVMGGKDASSTIGYWTLTIRALLPPRAILFILFPYFFHATFVLFPYYFNTISMLSSGYFAALFSCYFADDARNQSNYIKTNYPREENGMYQRLLYLFTRFEVLPNSNWHQKSVFRENCLKWKLSVEIPYFAFSSCQHLTLWNTNTTIRLV